MPVDCKDYGFKDCDKVLLTRFAGPVAFPNYPKPENSFRLVYQDFNNSIEEVYFWCLAALREDGGMYRVKKITDIFSSSEQSAFWGQAQNRLSIQQGQVSNYMATIGKLTKELFQIVRELRIIDERYKLYEESYRYIGSKDLGERRHSQGAEVTLRSYWVDLKDGGVKSPGSVYGLASTLGYTALPDLFFAAPPMKKDDVDRYCDGLKFNEKLKNVLRRKLKAYCVWKDLTYKELTGRKGFMIKFLRQHYQSIQMYIDWVKPYMRNVKRLQSNFQRTESEDLIGAFEGSFVEIEIVCYNDMPTYYKPYIVLTILFRTSPHMDYHQDGYQHKGPVHVGRAEIYLRGYAWTKKEFDSYLRMREDEKMEIIKDIDESLGQAIESLGDDMKRFLKEAGEKFPEDERAEKEAEEKYKKRMAEMKNVAEPFTALFSGFKEIFEAFTPKQFGKKPKGEPSDWEKKNAKAKATSIMRGPLWATYKNFKKAHKMVTW